MEENKELETTTEEQASVTPAANNGEKKGLFLSGLIVGFAATLLIVGGIFIAFQIHNIMTMKDDVAAQVSYGEDSAVNAQTIKKLQLLEDTVKENFYLSEVTNEQLEDGMFRGLMDSLDDPYSEYYTAEELNELTEQTQGIYFGIGAYVSMDSETNLPKISGVIEGAPAADVDLRANDIIYPCGMVKEMWSSAGVRLPYRKVTSLNSMSPSMFSISVYSRSSSCSDS